jgi:hypothetical protein
MNEKLEDILENYGTHLLAGTMGAVIGTVDATTSGYPLITGANTTYDFLKTIFASECELEMSRSEATLFGASIPFAIKYNKEILDIVQTGLNYLS